MGLGDSRDHVKGGILMAHVNGETLSRTICRRDLFKDSNATCRGMVDSRSNFLEWGGDSSDHVYVEGRLMGPYLASGVERFDVQCRIGVG